MDILSIFWLTIKVLLLIAAILFCLFIAFKVFKPKGWLAVLGNNRSLWFSLFIAIATPIVLYFFTLINPLFHLGFVAIIGFLFLGYAKNFYYGLYLRTSGIFTEGGQVNLKGESKARIVSFKPFGFLASIGNDTQYIEYLTLKERQIVVSEKGSRHFYTTVQVSGAQNIEEIEDILYDCAFCVATKKKEIVEQQEGFFTINCALLSSAYEAEFRAYLKANQLIIIQE